MSEAIKQTKFNFNNDNVLYDLTVEAEIAAKNLRFIKRDSTTRIYAIAQSVFFLLTAFFGAYVSFNALTGSDTFKSYFSDKDLSIVFLTGFLVLMSGLVGIRYSFFKILDFERRARAAGALAETIEIVLNRIRKD